MPRRACPRCRSLGTLTLTMVLTALGVGEFSLAGVQLKFPARDRVRLKCVACGALWFGHLEGVEVNENGTITAGHFVEDVEESGG